MEFGSSIKELAVVLEGFNRELRKDYKAINSQFNITMKNAKQALKAKKYKDVVRYCDDGIALLNDFKTQIKESGAENKGIVAGNLITALKTMAKSVVVLLGVAGVGNIASNKIHK